MAEPFTQSVRKIGYDIGKEEMVEYILNLISKYFTETNSLEAKEVLRDLMDEFKEGIK